MNIKLFRKAILLIHGFAGGSYDYNSLNNDLELYNCFDVFTFTLPGHERMIIDKVTRKDWIKKAEDELEKIINAGYSEVYIIGHSMGGVIATYLGSKYKEVKKLVLAAPAFEFCNFKNNKINFIDSIKLIPSIFKNYTFREMMAKYFKVPLKTVKEFSYLVNDHYEDVKKINIPILLLWGNKDTTVPFASIKYVYDNVKSKDVELWTIDNINHGIFNNYRYQDIKDIIFCFLTRKENNKKIKHSI